MAESQRLTRGGDTLKASKAHYNCAVLWERKNDYRKAKNHLEQSLSLYPLPEAQRMMIDYEQIL